MCPQGLRWGCQSLLRALSHSGKLHHRDCPGRQASPDASMPILAISPTGLTLPLQEGWNRAPLNGHSTYGLPLHSMAGILKACQTQEICPSTIACFAGAYMPCPPDCHKLCLPRGGGGGGGGSFTDLQQAVATRSGLTAQWNIAPYCILHGLARAQRCFASCMPMARRRPCRRGLPTWSQAPGTMRCGSTPKVPTKCKLQYYRMSKCLAAWTEAARVGPSLATALACAWLAAAGVSMPVSA